MEHIDFIDACMGQDGRVWIFFNSDNTFYFSYEQVILEYEAKGLVTRGKNISGADGRYWISFDVVNREKFNESKRCSV